MKSIPLDLEHGTVPVSNPFDDDEILLLVIKNVGRFT